MYLVRRGSGLQRQTGTSFLDMNIDLTYVLFVL